MFRLTIIAVLHLPILLVGCAAPRVPVDPKPAWNGGRRAEAVEIGTETRPVGDRIAIPLIDGLPERIDVVAKVGGHAITAADLVAHVRQKYPNELQAALDNLIDSHIIATEAKRLGIDVDEPLIEAEREAKELVARKRARIEMGADANFERYVESEMQMSLHEYRDAERRQLREKYLYSRIIRYHQIAEDRARFRVILVERRDLAEKLLDELERGADFAILAKQHSLQAAADEGGLVPWLCRSAMTPGVADIAFSLEPNQVGPLTIIRDEEGRYRYQIIKLLDKKLGRRVDYAEVRGEVEASLKAGPVTQFEWIQWKLLRGSLYDIENRLSPGRVEAPSR
jgi:parvulin-like peptidyl-prolyl isomerase